ncbi:hypothetical protein I317_01188 [Kwoniella heveanensis CBS 569]|nr:hypothetical protein I317_01188 [Kwoniella heveanensis CBS 569]
MSTPDADGRILFEAASKWLSSSPAAAGLPNDVKLELYGLFKYIGSADGPTASRPSLFSPAARAKYDAWSAQHHKYASVTSPDGLNAARARYVTIARDAGWDGRVDQDDSGDDEEVDLENLDNDVPVDCASSKKGGDNAMGGVKVSVMSGGMDAAQGTTSPIHDAVVARSIRQIQQILEQDGGSINSKDEYGYTPLHLAADRGYPEIVEILLKGGADAGLQDEDELTAKDLAQVSGRDEIVAIMDQYARI